MDSGAILGLIGIAALFIVLGSIGYAHDRARVAIDDLDDLLADAGVEIANAASLADKLTAARSHLEAKHRELAAFASPDLTPRSGSFEDFRQLHRESATVADAWYITYSSANQSLVQLRRGQASLRHAQSSRSGNYGHKLRNTIDHLDAIHGQLAAEVQRGRETLREYNIRTGNLRDHIGSNFGARGLQWREELERRTAARQQLRKRE